MDSDNTSKQKNLDCMVCGEHYHGFETLSLSFIDKMDGTVTTSFLVASQYQGYQGIMQGGLVSTLLDETMTQCLFSQGIKALTAELRVRFIMPVRVGMQISLEARLLSCKRSIYHVEAFVTHNKIVLSRATAKFIEPKNVFT
ncbi:PaaI family thioesterase [Acerihabitans sp. TG2]|uniref:PaaI family thioesterase n=1 Tax=Acerihabitans sp. TG2 TaxID=3096008 RepID=UPI002B22BCF1|nr:PaaI family thioesterase [Acerihabitans sp. TG2]MEA9389690.1 PaaI family thioesterase [Acerihabitans sp. TG2]